MSCPECRSSTRVRVYLFALIAGVVVLIVHTESRSQDEGSRRSLTDPAFPPEKYR